MHSRIIVITIPSEKADLQGAIREYDKNLASTAYPQPTEDIDIKLNSNIQKVSLKSNKNKSGCVLF